MHIDTVAFSMGNQSMLFLIIDILLLNLDGHN